MNNQLPSPAPSQTGFRASGVRLPAEWEPQEAVWLAWPHEEATWPGRFTPIPPFFARWARLLAESTPVRVLAADNVARDAEQALRDVRGVELIDIPTNDCWIRDYGPSFVVSRDTGQLRAVDWRYNAWGGKYPPWDQDDAAAGQIAGYLGIPSIRSEICLEGGAIETDGRGRLLTTPSCLLSDTRNRGATPERIAQVLHQLLGVTEVVWVDGGGMEGDDTDGHIDQLARFIDPGNVVVAVCDDPADPNHEPLEANYRQLHLWGATTHPHVEVHRLPLPPARYLDGKRVPESYCNFLRLGRQRLLVPTFASPPTDDQALGVLGDLLPHAELVPIDCRDLVWGLGALHCASRDQPAVAKEDEVA